MVAYQCGLKMEWFITVAVLAEISVVATQAETVYKTCPLDYQYYHRGRTCFRFYSNYSSKTWEAAREHCQLEGADLSVVRDEGTSRFIKQISTTPFGAGALWLGLREITKGSNSGFVWIDNSPVTYADWCEGAPSGDDPDGFNCVEQYSQDSESWNDRPCTDAIPFVCEKPALVYNACPFGFVSNVERKKCVRVWSSRSSSSSNSISISISSRSSESSWSSDSGISWSQGRQSCQELGSDVAVISDDADRAFVENLLKDEGTPARYWVGLTKEVGGEASGFGSGEGMGERYIDSVGVTSSFENSGDGGQGAGGVLCGGLDWFEGEYQWVVRVCEKGVADGVVCQTDFYQPKECPSDGDWTLNTGDGQCYKIQTEEKKSFNESRADCQQEGGDLAMVSGTQAREFVIDLIRSKMKTFRRFWVGLYRPLRNSIHQFEWLNGQALSQSEPQKLTSDGEENCGTFQSSWGKYSLTDYACRQHLPSICQRPPIVVLGHPVLQCPHDFTTYVTTGDWHSVCLTTGSVEPVPWSTAVEDCSRKGGQLFDVDENEHGLNSLVQNTLLTRPNMNFWTKRNDSCVTYSFDSNVFEERPCYWIYTYVCQHTGILRNTLVNLKNFSNLIQDKDFILFDERDGQRLSIDDLCKTPNLTELFVMYNWTTPVSPMRLITERDIIKQLVNEQHAACQAQENKYEHCCVLVDSNPDDNNTEFSFTMDRLQCLCRDTPATSQTPTQNITTQIKRMIEAVREATSLLKNLTTPKNESAGPPPTMCPCRCDSLAIDFNPSPQVLGQILSKIQRELKVDSERLSSKRNKKTSAPDSRTGSQAIAYVSIALCLAPVSLLIVLDMSRLFK